MTFFKSIFIGVLLGLIAVAALEATGHPAPVLHKCGDRK
jgi:hypothetical protein